ncbi:MAG: xanthine dehydrogenase subunit XdhB [Lachnospirales bacterium]
MFDILDYYEAKDLKDAFSYLQKNENTKIIAGGTDVLIRARERSSDYININLLGVTRIPELKEIRETDTAIFIGASATFTEIENSDVVKNNISIVATAVGQVGGPQVRNAGTIGGNICNGATSADSATSLFVLDAMLVIENENGRREESIHDFYEGPGRVKLGKTDIVVGFKINKENFNGYKGHYIKFAQRNAMDIATLGCSVLLKENNNKIEDIRIAFGVAGPTPLRATSAEEMAKGLELTKENIEKIANKTLESTKARDSWRGSKAYRENLAVELTKRAIETCKGE